MVTVTKQATATLTQADLIAAVSAFLFQQGDTVGSNLSVVLDSNMLQNDDPTTVVATATWTVL